MGDAIHLSYLHIMKTSVRILMASLLIAVFLVCATRALAGAVPTHIIVSQDANYPPFSYMDGDIPTGYLIDIWKAFGQANNIEISFLLGSWQDSLDFVRTGQADVHGGLFYSEDRDQFLDYGPTITDISTFLYARKDLTESALQCAIGVVRGGFEEEFLHRNRFREILTQFDDNRQLLTAAADGAIQCFAADQPTASYFMNIFGMSGRFASVEELYRMPMRVAVRHDEPELLAAINDGWKKLDPKTAKYIHGKWFVEEPETPGWIKPTMTYSALVFVVALILLFVVRRRGLRQ